ncbi:MAG TPA: glycoside hydrolase family 127 protein [Candidatus Hydrogenedentes bacterium]|nr:glycoside hydrolase family 127 protein [Candidatus Hydrogenedentota bacterium]HPG68010.1 glycoside hydrolase family 127 protein [Candidatus Hydrogenedentota bacterium]
MVRIAVVALCVVAVAPGVSAQAGKNAKGVEAGQPRLRLRLGGETGRRIDSVVRNWILTTPDANPGILEMFRLRDLQPPYENPVPWAGEFIGKYLTSAALLRRMTDNPEVDALLREVIPELISTQAEDGYLGPFPDNHLMANWDLWGHYHVMLALDTWYRDTGDTAALDAAVRAADLCCATFLDSDHRVYDAGSYEMNMAIIHALGILHRETGNEAYFRLMKDILEDWEKPGAGDYYRTGVAGVEFYQIPKPRWESLHPMQGLEEMYLITGDDSFKNALLHHWRSIYETDVHNAGSFSTHEQAIGNPFKPGAIETCCTVAWLAYSVSALRLSMDPLVADALECGTWNAVLGYEHPSGRWCTYDTPMSGKRLASAHTIVFQSRPGTPELNCCSANGPRGLGLISDWAILGDSAGLYLNYYGRGAIEATLDDGTTWSFVQKTAYPADGAIRLEVTPPAAARMPLFLRIPSWSRETTVSVNGEAVAGVDAGAYLRIEREWRSGDVVDIAFDMGVWALRGDENVNFESSLFRGPILLAFDQKFNTIEPSDPPALDLESLELEPATSDARFQPIVLFKVKAVDGREVFLCDYATAGAHGTLYRSWIPVLHAPPVPFRLRYPEDNARLAVDEVGLAWSSAGPDARYTAIVARDADLGDVVLRQETTEVGPLVIDEALAPNVTHYWRVDAQTEGQTLPCVNGPWRFTIDPTIQSSMKGVILRASLAGRPDPDEGALVSATDVAAAAGRDGAENGALHFNGTTSRLVYEAPQFPLRTYTFSAWFRPENATKEDTDWHQIFSAWYQGVHDPLRVSVKAKQLVVNIEQPSGGAHLPGPEVENDRWLHVAVVKEYDQLRLYVNGAYVHAVTVPALLVGDVKTIGIGCNPNLGEPESFEGAIADVFFSREALSAEDVSRLFDGTYAP